MLRAWLSVVVAFASAGVLLAGAWALQTAGLPAPTGARWVAADASRWLHDYLYSVDIFHSSDRRLRGACLRGWYPRRLGGRTVARGSLLIVRGRVGLLQVGGRQHVRLIRGQRRPDLPTSLLVAAGCTSSLGDALYAAEQGNAHLSVERAYAANQPALALEVGRVRDERLTLFVSPRQFRPLVAIVAKDGRVVTARIYLTRATAHLRSRFRQLLARRASGAA